jgi:hypothetical protein
MDAWIQLDTAWIQTLRCHIVGQEPLSSNSNPWIQFFVSNLIKVYRKKRKEQDTSNHTLSQRKPPTGYEDFCIHLAAAKSNHSLSPYTLVRWIQVDTGGYRWIRIGGEVDRIQLLSPLQPLPL